MVLGLLPIDRYRNLMKETVELRTPEGVLLRVPFGETGGVYASIHGGEVLLPPQLAACLIACNINGRVKWADIAHLVKTLTKDKKAKKTDDENPGEQSS
jgi:hypothetical protein